MKLLIFVIFFLLVGVFLIVSNENIQLNSSENIDHFFQSYAEWLDKIFINTKTTTGYIIQMKWMPE